MNKYILFMGLLLVSTFCAAQEKIKLPVLPLTDYRNETDSVNIKELLSKDENAQPLVHNDQLLSYCWDMPTFPGGEEAMMKFIADNLVYPDSAQKAQIEGCVIAGFWIKEDGSISDITIEESINKTLDDEVVRVVSLMPKWKWAKEQRVESEAYFALPIVFKLKR